MKPPVPGVSRKTLGEPGCSASAPATAAGQVVDDQILGDAAEEGPGRLQSVDDVFQFLAEGMMPVSERVRPEPRVARDSSSQSQKSPARIWVDAVLRLAITTTLIEYEILQN